MPTSKYFDECPSFPSDVTVANIPTISFKDLERNCESEAERLFEASREYGVFLLDLKGSREGEKLLRKGGKMFDIAATTFNLDNLVLENYAYNPPRDLFGYKCAGKLKTDDGKLDAMEMYNISQDDMLGNGPPRQNPEPIETNRQECQEFFKYAHTAVCMVLLQLDKQLGLASGTLTELISPRKLSDTSARLLLSSPQSTSEGGRITLGGHTDIGVITLLFNVAGGLQILPADSENINTNWRYVRPEPGCAVINLGDTLVEWTGGVLRSSLHRVVTAPGEQAGVTRQSVAYLIRPDHDRSMRRLNGSNVIPPLADGEEDETRSVDDWAAWRARQVMNGELKAQTRGGNLIRHNDLGTTSGLASA